MQEFPINWWAVIVAAAVKFVIGAVWYSPALFARQWLAATKQTEAEMRAGLVPAMGVEVVCDLVVAFILLHAVHYAGANNLVLGAAVGFLNWLGFIATFTLGQVFYERKPWSVWVLSNGYWVISLIIMGAILAVWP